MKRCLLIILVITMMLCGCGQQKAQSVHMNLPEADMVQTIEYTDEMPIAKNQNLLTGIEDLSKEAIGKRPIAVMINNVEEALPQYGITEADVIFEMPVEGDLTRLMALYADYTEVPDICAIRSCRYYFPAIAKGFDAFYVHWGMDPTIKGYIAGLGINRYDGLGNTGGLFGRDKDRRSAGYSLEHTGYFAGSRFAQVAKERGDRLELLDSKKGTAFRFCGMTETVTPNGETCNKVNIRFGGATATLNYNADEKLYYKEINDHAHIDGKTKEQLAFTNVFVLETSISVRDSAGHKELNWAGSSRATGYYISNGAVQKIRWSKANGDEDSYLKFYDENGKELVINRGKSYIAYTYKGKTSLN